jgi:hypothetical protein
VHIFSEYRPYPPGLAALFKGMPAGKNENYPDSTQLFYSYRKASMGSGLAALCAGYQPKKTPATTENIDERRIENSVMEIGHPAK